ncbi:MAG TPA: Na+ dependent nucleoside transporter N-terminal domain-containing protein, partial [Bacteroidia bacterium]|nr:Na+ dependent nucleoside transporter N-terminal domain-containing protein [Bacteroidia bacterium]
MDRFFGIFGFLFILGIAYLMSNNKKAINLRLVLSGLGLQLILAFFILKTSVGQMIFHKIAEF